MRKVALAALCGTLVLAACSQDTPSPTEPAAPEASAAIKCIVPGFPIVQALAQISGTKNLTGLYPITKPKPLALALARVAEVAALWTVCKPTPAQAKVVEHTIILLNDYRNGQLIGGTSTATAERVIAHINTMWQGVGVQPPNLPIFSGTDFGVGLFTPGTDLLVKTGSSNGAVRIPGNGFTQNTLVAIVLRSSGDNPFEGTGEEVTPPFYEIIAANAAGTHFLAGTALAVVGFCVDDAINPEILEMFDPAIAHIAVTEGSNPGGFEILDNATAAQYAQLLLDCPQFSPPAPPIGSLFDGGLRGFASNAPRYFRSAVASLLLPARAEAAVALGKTGLGGLARSLSPFGVVDRGGPPLHLELLELENRSGDPAGEIFTGKGSVSLKWKDSHSYYSVLNYPSVVLRDPQGNGIGGVQVTVTLERVSGSAGTLSGTTVVTTNASPGSTLQVGEALFNNLTVSGVTNQGVFRLTFSAPGAVSLTTGNFTVKRSSH